MDCQSGKRKPKRDRITFTRHQEEILETYFLKRKNPTDLECQEFSKHFLVPPNKISIWFKNRRSRKETGKRLQKHRSALAENVENSIQSTLVKTQQIQQQNCPQQNYQSWNQQFYQQNYWYHTQQQMNQLWNYTRDYQNYQQHWQNNPQYSMWISQNTSPYQYQWLHGAQQQQPQNANQFSSHNSNGNLDNNISYGSTTPNSNGEQFNHSNVEHSYGGVSTPSSYGNYETNNFDLPSNRESQSSEVSTHTYSYGIMTPHSHGESSKESPGNCSIRSVSSYGNMTPHGEYTNQSTIESPRDYSGSEGYSNKSPNVDSVHSESPLENECAEHSSSQSASTNSYGNLIPHEYIAQSTIESPRDYSGSEEYSNKSSNVDFSVQSEAPLENECGGHSSSQSASTTSYEYIAQSTNESLGDCSTPSTSYGNLNRECQYYENISVQGSGDSSDQSTSKRELSYQSGENITQQLSDDNHNRTNEFNDLNIGNENLDIKDIEPSFFL